MLRFIFSALILFSCVTAFASKRLQEQTFARMHILVTPDVPSKKPRPLLVLLHGCKMTAEDVLNVSEIEKYVDKGNFTVVAPGQSPLNNYDRCWNFFDKANQTPISKGAGFDLTTISTIVADTIAESNGTIDPTRVYIAGISSGAAMALNAFLCDSQVYRGIAMHSGLTFGTVDMFNWEGVLARGSGLSADELKAKLDACPKKNLDVAKIMAFHGAIDTRVHPNNFTELKTQLGISCDDELGGDPNHDFRLIEGLAHQWSGSQFPHKYASADGPSFTEAMLRNFGIIK